MKRFIFHVPNVPATVPFMADTKTVLTPEDEKTQCR